MSVRINGDPRLQFQGNDFDYDPREGIRLSYPYHGAVAVARAYANYLMSIRVPFEFRQTGDTASVRLKTNTVAVPIDAGYVETPLDDWSLVSNEMQEDWKKHPGALVMKSFQPAEQTINGKSMDIISAVEADVQARQNGTGGSINTTGGFQITNSTALAIYQSFLPLLLNGQNHYSEPQPVLRHSQVISRDYAGAAGFNSNNFNTIYTTTKLLTECAAFPYPLPAVFVAQINALPVNSAATGYQVGWLKKPTNGNTIAGNKIEMVTEYWYYQWSTLYYNLAP